MTEHDYATPLSTSPSPIPLVLSVTQALAAADIDYCHWKSNASIERGERGDTDLDLLVARTQASEFTSIASSLGFLEATRPRSPSVPGTQNLIGYDTVAERFVHLHVHYQLVLGHDRTKNFRIPIEDAYLRSSRVERLLPVPAPEFEYVVFILRMLLKYALLDEAVWAGLRGRKAGPEESELEELELLSQAIDPTIVDEILAEHLPYLDRELFEQATAAVNGELGVLGRARVARSVTKALQPYARNGRLRDGLLRVGRRLVVTWQRRSGNPSRYELTSGGATIAILGGDGSGKTTNLATLESWLGRFFSVTRVHLGKPDWSWSTYLVRGALKFGAKVRSFFVRDSDENQDDSRRRIWLTLQARDRYKTFKLAHRAANRGDLVISDRFPHPALTLMESPQIERITHQKKRSRFVQTLIRNEEKYHSRITQPEIVVVLMLEPHEAGRRKTDEPYDYVVSRASDIWDIDWALWGVKTVDSSRSREEVAADIKSYVWSALGGSGDSETHR